MHRAFTLTIALLVGATTAACGGSADQESDTGGVVVRDISVDTVDGSDISAQEPEESPADDLSLIHI